MDRLFVIALLGLFSGNCLAIEATGEIRTNILTEISVSASVIEGETAKTLYKFLSPAAQEIEPGVWFKKGTNISCLEIKNQKKFQCSFIGTEDGGLEPNEPVRGGGGFSISN